MNDIAKEIKKEIEKMIEEVEKEHKNTSDIVTQFVLSVKAEALADLLILLEKKNT